MKTPLLKNREIFQMINFIILLNMPPTFTLEINNLKSSPSYDSGNLNDCSCLRWTNWINLGNTIDLIHLPQTYESLANFGKIAANYEQIDICTVPVSSDCRIFVKDVDPNYPDDRYMACPQVKHIYGTEYGWVQMRFLCWDYTCPCLEWSQWYNYDGPKDDGDIEILGKTISYEEWPCPDGTSVFDVDCRTVNGKLLSETNNRMLRCDLDGFQCLNDLQSEHCICEDFMVRFLCLKSSEKKIRHNLKECGQEDCEPNVIYEESKKPVDKLVPTAKKDHWQIAESHFQCSKSNDTSKCSTSVNVQPLAHSFEEKDIAYPEPPAQIHGYGTCFYPKHCPEVNLWQMAELHLRCSKSNDTSECFTSGKAKISGRSFKEEDNVHYPWPPEKIYGYGPCIYNETCPKTNLWKLAESVQQASKITKTADENTVKITKSTTAMILTPQTDRKTTEKSQQNDYYEYTHNEKKDIEDSPKKLQHETKETPEFVSYEGGTHYGRSFGKHEGMSRVTKNYEMEKETIFARQDYYTTQKHQRFNFNTPPPLYQSVANRYEQIGPKSVYDTVETEHPIAVDVTKYQADALKEHHQKATEKPRFLDEISNDEEEKSELIRKPDIEVVRTEDGEELIVEALPGKAEKPLERPPIQTVETYGGPRRKPPMGRRPSYGHRPPLGRKPSHYPGFIGRPSYGHGPPMGRRPSHYPEFIEKRPLPPVHYYAQRRQLRPYPGYYYPESGYWPSYNQYYERPPPPRYELPQYGQRDGLYRRKYGVRSWGENKDAIYRINRKPIRQGYGSEGAYKHERYEDVVYVHDRPYSRRH